MPAKIMIIAGEASGDTHGASLIRALRKRAPDIEVFGVGGDKMKSEGMHLYYHVDQLSYIGFSEVVRHLSFFRRVFRHLLEIAGQRQPDLIVLIDYPGFNLRFAKSAKRRGFKIFYFVAPQVWAWAKWRAKKMARYIDRLAVLFDFEVSFFQQYGLETKFVGHPLVDKLVVRESKEEFCKRIDMDPQKPILGLFPGSRHQELSSLLPEMLATAQLLSAQHPHLQVVVSKAPTIDAKKIKTICQAYPQVRLVEGHTYEMMNYVTAGIVASGTATLEMAFFKTPFVVVYKVSPITFAIGKKVIKIPHIGLVNVVAGREIVPEFIQKDAVAEKVAPVIQQYLYNERIRKQVQDDLSVIKQKLGEPGAAERTAELVLEMI